MRHSRYQFSVCIASLYRADSDVSCRYICPHSTIQTTKNTAFSLKITTFLMQILLHIKNSITLYCGRDFSMFVSKKSQQKSNKKSIKNKPLKPIL
jgi:hypothetical protein